MDAPRNLSPRQLDAMREVATIGAGHAATALSEMTGQTIMISVPRLVVSAVNEIPNHVQDNEEPVAAVLLRMLGDLTGLTLLVLPRATALRVAEMMAHKPHGTYLEMGPYEQSAIKEAGNILSAAYLKLGAVEDGLATITAALATGDATDSPLWDPEFHRLEGELFLARDPAAGPEAERAFHQAIDLARQHRTKSLELRSATSLGRLWQRQGKRQEAARLLGEIYGWFTEGFDTADLRAARGLLDELEGPEVSSAT